MPDSREPSHRTAITALSSNIMLCLSAQAHYIPAKSACLEYTNALLCSQVGSDNDSRRLLTEKRAAKVLTEAGDACTL